MRYAFWRAASVELVQQGQHYDTKYHLVHSIRGIPKEGGEYEVLVKWIGFKEGDGETWEAISNIKKDLPAVLEDFLQTSTNRNLKGKFLPYISNPNSTHTELLGHYNKSFIALILYKEGNPYQA